MSRKKQVDVVEIRRHGEALLIPESMTLHQAKKAIERQIEYDEEVVQVSEPISGSFIWDGAIAFSKAMQRMFGWATAEPTPDFFGPQPPQLQAVATGYNQTTNVVLGRFSVPGIDGFLTTGHTFEDGRVIFQIGGQVKRKNEDTVKRLADLTRKIVREESIYRGKAFRMRFRDDFGDTLPLPEPRFLDLSHVKRDELIFPADVQQSVETNIFTLLEHREVALENGVPFKRGILAEGPYGVGKTLLSLVTAKVATDNGVTYIYLERADELADALRFAQNYEPAVIFTEDIDRATTGERTVQLDHILNTIDGIDSKHGQVMVILTTNHPENINPAMRRPGRLDAVISIRPPNAEAAERLVRLYGRGLIDPEADLTEVGEALEGQIPAVIREAVERSKLAVIRRIGAMKGQRFEVTADDLLVTIQNMQTQLRWMAPQPKDTRSDLEKAFNVFGNHLVGAARQLSRRVDLNELDEGVQRSLTGNGAGF